MYDLGLLKSYQSHKIFTISIGNLTVGGTGKTPHVEYFVLHFLKYKPVVLSRGYGRKTKGYKIAQIEDTAEVIGDEPLQIFNKFNQHIPVVVCENRVEGVKRITEDFPDCKLIILDDAFQHRALNPHFQVLLNDFNRPFYEDYLLPAGRLRERRVGAKRANMVIVSKTPRFCVIKEEILCSIKPYINDAVQILFSTNEFGQITNYVSKKALDFLQKEVVLVSAIAQPQQFENQFVSKYSVKKHFQFSDHHSFKSSELLSIIDFAENLPIITTEKDFVKINALLSKEQLASFYYLPLFVRIENDLGLLEEIMEKMNAFYDKKC